MNKAHAISHSIAIITAGLQSGSIKLIGPIPGSNIRKEDITTEYAKADAAYLTTLLTELSSSIQSLGD